MLERDRATEEKESSRKERELQRKREIAYWSERCASVRTERLFRLFYWKHKGKIINSNREYFFFLIVFHWPYVMVLPNIGKPVKCFTKNVLRWNKRSLRRCKWTTIASPVECRTPQEILSLSQKDSLINRRHNQ